MTLHIAHDSPVACGSCHKFFKTFDTIRGYRSWCSRHGIVLTT